MGGLGRETLGKLRKDFPGSSCRTSNGVVVQLCGSIQREWWGFSGWPLMRSTKKNLTLPKQFSTENGLLGGIEKSFQNDWLFWHGLGINEMFCFAAAVPSYLKIISLHLKPLYRNTESWLINVQERLQCRFFPECVRVFALYIQLWYLPQEFWGHVPCDANPQDVLDDPISLNTNLGRCLVVKC